MMNIDPVPLLSSELHLNDNCIRSTIQLLDEGATIPFIARYRKEMTGSMDEVEIMAVRDRLRQLRDLEERRESILKSLEQQGHLNEELGSRVRQAATMAELEDIYLPFKPKRRTRAAIAREKGLEPLALRIFEQQGIDPRAEAEALVDPEKELNSVEDVLSGARDIIAEIVNEDEKARAMLRAFFNEQAVIKSTVIQDKVEQGAKYRDYFEWTEPAATAPSHRILAMRRGEKEDFLNLEIRPDSEEAIQRLESLFVRGGGEDTAQARLAVQDAYRRLLSRSMETELRVATKDRADAEAIRIFSENLRQLLLAPPLGTRPIMGIDPGFRTGCKLACLDSQGKLLCHDTIFPFASAPEIETARRKIRQLCETHGIEAIAVGNGTAGRETETFVRSIEFEKAPHVVMVNESGASIYSASEVARTEFPDLDLTFRGAVSIGRRLMDPLAELVKIDPKSIGVGQYQHDVDQNALKEALDEVVASCVNAVGVEVNTASIQLLTYVSGLGPQLARNIVAWRDNNGPFASRSQLRDVPRLGPKAFEQCAGFLRIRNAANPLDASAVHPESYGIVDAMAAELQCNVNELMIREELRRKIDIQKYVTETVGIPTLEDIIKELAKPGRDPRQTFTVFAFDAQVQAIGDLKPGMRLPGIVTNITAFGAFVDIGVHQDGLIHVSEMADRFVKNPADIVAVGQQVQVRVMEVDLNRKRIALSMKTGTPTPVESMRADVKKQAPSGKNPKHTGQAQKNRPFNNPFADLLGKR